MEAPKSQPGETVILILGDKRVEAFRDKLALKSLYFASLFSHNFSDSLQKEYAINYDIAFTTLQDFVNWTMEDVASVFDNHHYVKPCLTKYVSDDHAGLLQLLQLSVLLMAESLSEDLTDIIIRHWLLPQKLLEIWPLAEELNLTVLRDVAKAACLDRFQDLSVPSLMELPKESFMQLVGNVNVQATESYLLHLVQKWIQRNDMLADKNDILCCVDPLISSNTNYEYDENRVSCDTQMEDGQSEVDFDNTLEQRKPRYIQCVVGHKLGKYNEKRACIYSWNGQILSELVELKDTMSPGNNILGMQVVGRGFNIYMVGGEQGLSTGRFNMNIWRYCILSRKWYFVSSLPEPRRHMAVAFINEKLMIMGGVGRHRLKLSTVDVFNIHTGEWSKAADVPEEFTSVPPTCEVDGKLFMYKSLLYTYDPSNNTWTSTKFEYLPQHIKGNFLMAYKNVLYIVGFREVNRTVLWKIDNITHPAQYGRFEFLTACDRHECHAVVADGPNLITFSYVNGSAIVTVGTIGIASHYKPLCNYTEERADIYDMCHEAPMGCFNVVNPNSLHQQFSPCHRVRKTNILSQLRNVKG